MFLSFVYLFNILISKLSKQEPYDKIIFMTKFLIAIISHTETIINPIIKKIIKKHIICGSG